MLCLFDVGFAPVTSGGHGMTSLSQHFFYIHNFGHFLFHMNREVEFAFTSCCFIRSHLFPSPATIHRKKTVLSYAELTQRDAAVALGTISPSS